MWDLPILQKMQPATQIKKGSNDKIRKSSLNNHESRKKLCRDAHTIPDDAEIDELDPSEFEMNGEHFMLPVFFTT